ncbi:SDR family oxidoreductase [Shewanella sp. A32]|uniref:SDR family NAD(P)-dependent oxidoreductase n=1 Tax=Shewanella sp. A32 TaxID=3031327 RepID=UPI0023B9E83A|nr:SDR family oxidoreductase [Shewanella sp. A32]MDF0532941.1 SDR family oxidoreductase [Shewanella sp. A32]
MTKLVMITGGNRGIGATLVDAFANAGFRVAFSYCHNQLQAQALQQKLSGDIACFALDQAQPQSITECLVSIKKHFGQLPDILINNGAIAQEKPFDEISADDFSIMMETNLRGPFLLAQGCIAHMQQQQWGRIINISSVGGQWGGFNQVHYAAAKAGLINLSQSIAKIYSKDGIYCNTIAIGLVATEMTARELNSEAGKRKVASIPMQRLGSSNEIAALALFLAGDNCGYLSGQTLNANGGMYLG